MVFVQNNQKNFDERLQKLTYQNLRQFRPDNERNFDKKQKKIEEYWKDFANSFS